LGACRFLTGMTRTAPFLIALLVALLVPAVASADWLPVEEVGNIEESDQEFRTAANDRGDAIVLWRDNGGIRVSVSRRGGPFGPALSVPGSKGGVGADVDVNEDGRAIVWWRDFVPGSGFRIELAGLKVDGGFGKPRVVTPASEYLTFSPVIGPGGRFAFVYSTGQRLRPVYARVAPPSGRLGPRITLASGSIRPVQLYYLGNRPMIDYLQASDDYSRVRERQIGSGGARVLLTIPKHGIVAMDTASNGAQVALWSGGNTDTPPTRPLMAATRRPDRAFGKAETLDNRLPPQEYAVAVGRRGEALVAWRDWNESTTEDGPSPTPDLHPATIVYSYHWAGTGFSARGRIRVDGDNAAVENLSAAMNSDGLGVLAWNGGRFTGMDRRLYTARIYRGDDPTVDPMTGFESALFNLDGVEVDERSRTVFGWVHGTKVLARRGTWGVNQP
jgi:hypothetical protein